MRFKAKLSTYQVQLLHNLINPISRLSGAKSNLHNNVSILRSRNREDETHSIYQNGGGQGSVIYLDPEYLRISTKGKSGGEGEGIICFAELSAKDSSDGGTGIFLEHRIESAADNVIVFEIDLTQMKMALQGILEGGSSFKMNTTNVAPLHNSNSDGNDASLASKQPTSQILHGSIIILKLAKRNSLPCLCLDSYAAGGSVEVHHAIPVRIIRADEMQHHLPPQISMPDVQLQLPSDRPLKPVIERFRAISSQVYIEGCMAGELTLRIDGEGASIRTFYGNLIPRFEDCKSTPDQNPPAKVIMKVDSKKLNACLHWQATMALGRGAASSAVLCLVENEMLVLHVSLNPGGIGFFTYYVPIHYLSPDDIT